MGYCRDHGTASHEGKDEMHPVPQACMKCAGDADLVIEAVELGHVTYAREAVTQLVGSPKANQKGHKDGAGGFISMQV